ncbi:hypothetical protein BH11ARM2_BH11ARM2_33820 [soil metagenome]
MGSAMAKFVGRQVVVWTKDAKDEGVVEEFDGVFLRITSNGETMLFPYTAIRLVKVLD